MNFLQQIYFFLELNPHILGHVIAPLIFIVAILTARTQVRRVMLVFAVGALILLLFGTVNYDGVSHLTYQSDIGSVQLVTSPYSTSPEPPILVAATYFALEVGSILTFGAAILGLGETVRTRRWGWFAAIVVFLLPALVIGTAPYAEAIEELSLFNQHVSETIFSSYLLPESASASEPFYVIASVLIVVSPLATLIYALIGRERPEVKEKDPEPVAATASQHGI